MNRFKSTNARRETGKTKSGFECPRCPFDEPVSRTFGRKSSPEFCKAWKKHEVARSGAGRKTVVHPVVGAMRFEHAVFNPQEEPDQRMILYSPMAEDDTPAKLARLLAS